MFRCCNIGKSSNVGGLDRLLIFCDTVNKYANFGILTRSILDLDLLVEDSLCELSEFILSDALRGRPHKVKERLHTEHTIKRIIRRRLEGRFKAIKPL